VAVLVLFVFSVGRAAMLAEPAVAKIEKVICLIHVGKRASGFLVPALFTPAPISSLGVNSSAAYRAYLAQAVTPSVAQEPTCDVHF
jgi:hypothetical protein